MCKFPLSYKLSTGVSSVQVQKRKPEGKTIHISNQGQHINRGPFEDFWYNVYVFLFLFVNNVNVEHFHIWSLYIFCNPLLQNILQVVSRPDSQSDPIGGSEPSSGCETIYWDSLPTLSDIDISNSCNYINISYTKVQNKTTIVMVFTVSHIQY